MKSKRQEIIISLVKSNEIETQSQLQEALLSQGISATQATLSRDIKDLHLSKRMNRSGKSVYAVEESEHKQNPPIDKLLKIFKECVKSYDIAQNIIVMKTIPGLASAACSAFDTMSFEHLVGTIAGDDTALLIFKDNTYAAAFIKEINSII